jgi:hypothetical protein
VYLTESDSGQCVDRGSGVCCRCEGQEVEEQMKWEMESVRGGRGKNEQALTLFLRDWLVGTGMCECLEVILGLEATYP